MISPGHRTATEPVGIYSRPRASRPRNSDPAFIEAERNRITELCRELNAKFNLDNDGVLAGAIEVMRRARAIDDPVSIAHASIVMSDCRLQRGESEVAVRLLDRAIARLQRSTDEATRMLLYRRLGDALQSQGRPSESLEAYGTCLTISESLGKPSHIARALGSMAITYRHMAEYPKALELMKRALVIFESIEDETGAYSTELNLGNVYLDLRDFDQAERHYLRVREQFAVSGNLRSLANVVANLGNVYSLRGELKRGLQQMREALALFRKVGDRHGEGNTLFGIGCNYSDQGKHRRSLDYLSDAIDVLRSVGRAQLVAEALLSRGKVHAELGDPELALADMHASLELAREVRHVSVESQACAAVAAMHESAGETAVALTYYKRHTDLQRRIAGFEVGVAIATLEAEERMDTASRQLASYRKRTEELADEIVARSQENAAMALHLTQNERFVERLREDVATMATVPGTDRDVAASILSRLRQAESGDAQWAQFERQFIRLHPEFLLTLRKRHPSLTLTEQRVCALLRLGMSSKEIANVLYSSVRTVEGHRHRIRKKLGLDGGDQLVITISSI